MAGWYTRLATEDAAALYGTPTASAEDADYPATNLITDNAANPSKQTTHAGGEYWDLDLGSARAIVAVALIYHNLDAGLSGVALTMGASQGASTFSQAITIPTHHEDGWPVSPYAVFASTQTYRWARLTIGGANSLNPQVGRLLLLTARHTLAWARPGATEDEEHDDIVLTTEAGVETVYSIGGKRRSLTGELPLSSTSGTTAAELLSLRRSAEGRRTPFLLVPDDAVNDAYYVRFDENKQTRAFQNPNYQTATIKVKETARGVPFP